MDLKELEDTARYREERRLRKEAEKAAEEAAKLEIKDVKIVDGQVILEEDDEEFDNDDKDDDAEQQANFSNALMLLQDCQNMFTTMLADPRVRVPTYFMKDLTERIMEIGVFLSDYDMNDVNDLDTSVLDFLPPD